MITLGGFVMSVTFDTIQLFDQSLDNDDRQLEVSILLFQTFFFFFFIFVGKMVVKIRLLIMLQMTFFGILL